MNENDQIATLVKTFIKEVAPLTDYTALRTRVDKLKNDVSKIDTSASGVSGDPMALHRPNINSILREMRNERRATK